MNEIVVSKDPFGEIPTAWSFIFLTPGQEKYLRALLNMQEGRTDPWTVKTVLAGVVETGDYFDAAKLYSYNPNDEAARKLLIQAGVLSAE